MSNENCTIGAVLTDTGLILFKNRDLSLDPAKAGLPAPILVTGAHEYIKFGTGKTGVWAGINAAGLGVVGADGNGIANLVGEQYGGGHLTWEAYEHVIANFTSVSEAYPSLVEFYEKNQIGGTGDIVLIADPSCALVLEYASPGIWGLQFCRLSDQPDPHTPPYILRTNFFITLSQFRPRPENSPVHMSSEARYRSALCQLAVTGKTTKVEDLQRMLVSHLNGVNTFSTCRHSGNNEYNTVGSVIMHVGSEQIEAHFVLNAHPCQKNYQILALERADA